MYARPTLFTLPLALAVCLVMAATSQAGPAVETVSTNGKLISVAPDGQVFVVRSDVVPGHAVGIPYKTTPTTLKTLRKLAGKKIPVKLRIEDGVIVGIGWPSR